MWKQIMWNARKDELNNGLAFSTVTVKCPTSS